MAYAAVISLAQTTDQILNQDQYPFSLPGKEKMKTIYDHAISLQTFLEDFPEKAKSLEGRIRDVANEAEDIIEYFMSEQIRSHVGLIESAIGSSRTKKTKFRRKLTKVAKEIDSIVAEVMSIKNSFIIKDVGAFSDFSGAASSSRLAPIDKDIMVGFDEDLLSIKARLCGEPLKLQALPIVGMGGIGKTTLAKNAFNDPKITESFDIRAWVTVSQDYSVQEILSSLLVSMKDFDTERPGQSNEEKVFKTLKSRRYLIVMDDIWSTKAWDEIRNIFPDDNNGSRILLTTRLLDVAAYPDPCSPLYEMHLMDADQSWNLLQQKVFAHHDCPLELKDIGKEIARSCRGLPLAIVVIAGLLSTVSKTRTSWKKFTENVNSAVAAKHGEFEEILSLSYTHLPHRLRPCFLYIGGFPKDREVSASKLVKLWVAEGFLKHVDRHKSLEEEAEECLEELVKRNLVLVAKRKSNGKIKSCNLHDLMRDLCIKKSHEEKFLVNVTGGYVFEKFLPTTSRENQRRVCVKFISGLPYLSKIYGSTIHSIMCFGNYSSLPSLESFRLLRVLDAGDAEIIGLPAQLFELFHLRYLAINYYGNIPAAISKLQNLQTLIVYKSVPYRFHRRMHKDWLPQEIWCMPQLRHLLFWGRLPHPEGTTSTLENLQTLSMVSHYMCTEGILKMIPSLKTLGIDCFDYVEGTHLNNLVHLYQLEILELRSSITSNAIWRKDSFTFPKMLKKLTLRGLLLPWNEMRVVGSLPNLQVLKLREFACEGSIWETTEGEFPKLEFLLIEESNLEHWITESSHFPRLKLLLLHNCRHLNEIPDCIGEIPTLELIEVKDLYEQDSLVESAKRIEKEQQRWGNDALQVRCMTFLCADFFAQRRRIHVTRSF